MLPALRRRKLLVAIREAISGLEDALTSTVWGHLRYLPWSRGLGMLLADIGLTGTAPGRVRFWPTFPGTEPDVLLDGEDWMVLVEARLHSGFGTSQLGREWVVLREQGGNRRLRLLAVARRHRAPSDS
ncbi:MAG: hypothetical protein ACI8S6_001510 [Myxococcota bacterium]